MHGSQADFDSFMQMLCTVACIAIGSWSAMIFKNKNGDFFLSEKASADFLPELPGTLEVKFSHSFKLFKLKEKRNLFFV
jgi:hypothetical protein